ncbi:MAG: acyltransferase [Sphingomicrobium sp.]
MSGKLRSVQVVRAVAACAVLLCHTAGWSLGAAGVDLFFVISGFIIGTVMPGRGARSFFADRLRRIYPIYFVALLPWALVGALFATIPLDRLVSSLTLWPIWGGAFVVPFNPPAWTLCFEMLFYVGAALALATKCKWLPFAIAGMAALLYQWWPGALLGFVGNPMILEFCAGLALTRLPRRAGVAGAAIPVALLLFALSPAALLADGALAIDAGQSALRVAWWGVPSLLLAYAALTFEIAFAGKAWDGAVLVGDASYSLYLTHVLPALILSWWWPVESLAILALGVAVHLAVEKPLLKRLGRPADHATPACSPATVRAT